MEKMLRLQKAFLREIRYIIRRPEIPAPVTTGRWECRAAICRCREAVVLVWAIEEIFRNRDL